MSGNSADDWAAARAALTAARGATTLDCLDREAYRLATELLAAHDADPGSPVRTGPATRTTACPYEVTGIAPTSGAAGTTVVIQGSYLWATAAVYFGSVKATIVQQQLGDEPLEVEVPTADGSGPVRVRVVSSYDGDGPDITPVTAISPQDFTYTPTSSTSPSASASASASPSPTDSSTPAGSGAASGAAGSDAVGPDAARRPRE